MPPDDPLALLRRTEDMLAAGPDPAARALLEASVARHPDHAPLICRLADALHLERRMVAAAAAYRRALALDPTLFDAWYGVGALHLAEKAYGAAAEALWRAIDLRPDAAAARTNLAEALYQLGEVDPALTEFRAVAASAAPPDMRTLALANIACIVPGSPAADNATVLADRRRWLAAAGAVPPVARPPRPPGAKLRVGYVSSYFGAANWMKPVFGVVNRHDRARFEVHLISLGADPSAAAGYADHPEDVVWQPSGLGNASLAGHIAAAGIDVLVDLNGYSDQARLELFARRPAPVQLGWFNMFATTGMEAFDALIGDDAAIPPDEDSFCCEKIVRVPGSYLAFSVLYPVPDPVPPPCLGNGFLTFGCLGSAYKITRNVVSAWAKILRAVPASRLLLKNGTLDDASNRAALLARFAAEGIGAERLTLEGRAPHFDFLAAYGRIDIALDTFPYNGGTTTTEALWQGVPVLAFNGDRWASRTSRSLLLAAGMSEWVAADLQSYVACAIALGTEPATPARLAAMRATMRARLLDSPACDSAGLCRALEDLYVTTARQASGGTPW